MVFDASTLFCRRALEGGCEMLPGSYRLLPLPAVELYHQTAAGARVTAVFAAQLTDPADAFAVGALGSWVPFLELLRQVLGPDQQF